MVISRTNLLKGFYIIIIMEIWKKIPGFENYEVSNKGNVKSLKFGKERILKLNINSKGYLVLSLFKNGKRKHFEVHQLVAIAFLNHKPDGFKIVVDHINEKKTDNRLENLQLITNRENVLKSIDKNKTSSKYMGVSWDKKSKKYRTQIRINGKSKYLGNFKNPKIAHAVYLNAIKNIC